MYAISSTQNLVTAKILKTQKRFKKKKIEKLLNWSEKIQIKKKKKKFNFYGSKN